MAHYFNTTHNITVPTYAFMFYCILCTSLAISYVLHLYVLIFVQYRTISIAMTRTGSKANETTNIQTPYFK